MIEKQFSHKNSAYILFYIINLLRYLNGKSIHMPENNCYSSAFYTFPNYLDFSLINWLTFVSLLFKIYILLRVGIIITIHKSRKPQLLFTDWWWWVKWKSLLYTIILNISIFQIIIKIFTLKSFLTFNPRLFLYIRLHTYVV